MTDWWKEWTLGSCRPSDSDSPSCVVLHLFLNHCMHNLYCSIMIFGNHLR